MSILDNSDIKKYLFINVIMLILCLVISGVNTFVTSNRIEVDIMKNNYSIVGTLANNNPGMEEDIIKCITKKNGVENISKGKEILERYGYSEKAINFEDPILRDSKSYILLLNMWITILIILSLVGISLIFFKRIYKELDKVNEFIEKVLEEKEVKNILDNQDGQIGRLKNELLRMTNALKQNVELLKGEKVFLNNVISDISHQLRTPMTSLMVLNDLLHNENLPKEKKEEFLLRTRSQLDRMEWLVKSMLKLAKVEAGVIEFKKEEKFLYELIGRALDPMRIPMEIKNQELILKGASEDKFTGDIEWSVEALVNIIKNCIEHTGENGKIIIEYEENILMSRIIIKDTGEGIRDKDLPHIFKRFYRGKSSRKTDSVGIGLAMAKSIIESQNGSVNVESDIGKGTTFEVHFYKGVI